jgi:hypothetical protein
MGGVDEPPYTSGASAGTNITNSAPVVDRSEARVAAVALGALCGDRAGDHSGESGGMWTAGLRLR